MRTRYALLCLLSGFLALPTQAQTEDEIRLNQVGFYPDGPKLAVVVAESDAGFSVVPQDGDQPVFEGTLSAPEVWEASGETVRRADFSSVTEPGTYVLMVEGLGRSHPFEIGNDVHAEVAAASIKGFYYQRVSTPLLEQHAGRWARAAGHPDDQVLVHASAASPDRPEGTVLAAPKGWYDAGDYNKYIVNSGITMGTLLSLYEDFPDHAATVELNIAESGNGVPDLLDEILWNLRWMLAMQDPADGGVYTKLTTADFEGVLTPENATNPRYVVQKSTPAALDFAAVAAQAARLYREHEDVYPGLADSSLNAALAAWNWARSNPDSMYRQWQMNQVFEPAITTGGYGDRSVQDEFAWAAVELSITTEADSFLQAVTLFPDEEMSLPSWPNVHALALYSLARPGQSLPATMQSATEEARRQIIAYADALVSGASASAYRIPMGTGRDFIWGSNSVAANQSVALINAYRLTQNPEYLRYALANLDYILGRNATGYSFVTGHGDRPTMHPHHRPSEADDVADPVPGLLAGGPNPGQQDGCEYPASEPARSYVDDWCSYASNEIAINWNAPLAYVAMALEALQAEITR